MTGMQLHRIRPWWHQTRTLPPDSTARTSAHGGGGGLQLLSVSVQGECGDVPLEWDAHLAWAGCALRCRFFSAVVWL